MKISILSRCSALWILVILISLVDAKPQGYAYPVPTNSNGTFTSTSTSTEEAADSAKETTTVFSGYITEDKEKSAVLAEGIVVTTASTSEETETTNPSNEESDKAVKNTSEESTENVVQDETTDKQETPSPTEETAEKENESEDIQESTTPSEDSETTTLISAPYPPSGSRPAGPEFSYNVRDLFPGTKQAASTTPQQNQPPPNENLSFQPQLDPRVGIPFHQEPAFFMNRLTSSARHALVSAGPQRSYYYQTPQQQMRFNSYPQQPLVNRNLQSERFMSFPSRSFGVPASYPPSRSSYDQRFTSSNVVAQPFYQPRGNENYEEPGYEFQYDVGAPPYGPFFGHQEHRTGEEARGQYYVVQPDGRRRVVQYEAGPQGYRPTISYEASIDYQDYP